MWTEVKTKKSHKMKLQMFASSHLKNDGNVKWQNEQIEKFKIVNRTMK